MAMIKIVHLSDFHFNAKHLSDWNSYFYLALIELLKSEGVNPTNSFIVCTGDILDKGGISSDKSIDESFADFYSNVVKGICNNLQLPTERFILTPGNHDINRNADSKAINLGLHAEFEENYSNLLMKEKAILDSDDREGIKRILPYKQFESEVYKNIEYYKSLFKNI